MVSALRLLDAAIMLSSDVLRKAGTVRYVRIKGGGEGGMDRVRLRNGMAAPPGFAVQRGVKGGLYFDVAPDVDLKALEQAAQQANGGGGAPAGINPGPQIQGQPMRTANQPAPQPAGQPKIPHSASPRMMPDTATGGPNERARRLGDLRARRAQAANDPRLIDEEINQIQRNVHAVLGQMAAGQNVTRNAEAAKMGIDQMKEKAAAKEALRGHYQSRQDAVQAEKRRQREADVRREERARQNRVRRDDHDQRHHNEPVRFNDRDIPGPSLGRRDAVSVAPLGSAGAVGVNGSQTYKAETRPGTFEPHHGLNETRVVYKTIADEVKPELAAYGLSQALGWDVVPEVRQADLGEGAGHTMRWADENGERGADSALAREYFFRHPGPMTDPNMEREFIQMWVLDSLIGNTDRHEQNYVVDPVAKKVWAIDSGRSGSNGYARGRLLGPNYLKETIKFGRTFEYDYGRRGRENKQRIKYGPKQRAYAKSLIAHVKQNEEVLRKVVTKLDPQAMRGFERRLSDLYGQTL